MFLVYLAAKTTILITFCYSMDTYHAHGFNKCDDCQFPYNQSALIFIAQNDYYFYEMGLELKNKFNSYTELISTSAGHALPTQSDTNFQSVVNFLDNLDSSGSDTSGDGNESSENLQSFRLNILQGDDLNNLQIIDTRIIESSAQNQFFKAELIPE